MSQEQIAYLALAALVGVGVLYLQIGSGIAKAIHQRLTEDTPGWDRLDRAEMQQWLADQGSNTERYRRHWILFWPFMLRRLRRGMADHAAGHPRGRGNCPRCRPR